MVSPASRMLRAISFGVFWREAPSTSLIIRSRKVSPGLEVIRTLISSERTRVPPVTAERSPPDSRMTGADSPVIADSSTEATPLVTSPSPGMKSPALTTTMSPERNFELGTSLRNESVTARVRILVSASDCFLTWATESMGASESLPCGHEQVFENRPQTEGREKSKRTNDQNRGYQQA